MDKIVVCRSSNDTLGSMAKSLLPDYEWIFLKGTSQLSYFQEILKIDADLLLNLDEDAFVSNRAVLEKHVKFIIDSGFDYSGFPDGGALPIRQSLPCSMNPFFNVFKWKDIKKKTGLTYENFHEKCIESNRELQEKISAKNEFLIKKLESVHSPLQFQYAEEYYSFFYLLYKNCNPFFIESKFHSQNPEAENDYTTILMHEKQSFLYHTWYSRNYNRDFDKKRIDNIFEIAKHENYVQ